jgi:predicted Fe-S protein YdhL (DUF1289 family)
LNKYTSWVRLNVEGKRLWGHIFPDGVVPVQTITTQRARLKGIREIESVFTVNWKALTKEQQQAILDRLSKRTGAKKETIMKEISNIGLPLRRRYTAGCGTNRMDLFP